MLSIIIALVSGVLACQEATGGHDVFATRGADGAGDAFRGQVVAEAEHGFFVAAAVRHPF